MMDVLFLITHQMDAGSVCVCVKHALICCMTIVGFQTVTGTHTVVCVCLLCVWETLTMV